MKLVKFIEMSSDLMDYNSLVVDLLTSDHPAIAFDVTYRVLDSKVLVTELVASWMIFLP